MKKARISYSLIKAWGKGSEGSRERMFETYMRLNSFSNEHTDRGAELDKKVRSSVESNQCLPPELGGEQLSAMARRGRHSSVEFNDKLDISFEFDVEDLPDRIIEIKSSVSNDSAHFLDSLQIDMYFLVCDLLGLPVKVIDVYRHDPQHRTFDKSRAWKSQRRINNARQVVETKGAEIYQALEEEGILDW